MSVLLPPPEITMACERQLAKGVDPATMPVCKLLCLQSGHSRGLICSDYTGANKSSSTIKPLVEQLQEGVCKKNQKRKQRRKENINPVQPLISLQFRIYMVINPSELLYISFSSPLSLLLLLCFSLSKPPLHHHESCFHSYIMTH